ncbi:hypothetical protein FRB99_007614 [Tulasnella sp. 403]|nr:hypothetical protein FRB99_007614 [Tulasnella sp. 403]
MHPFLIGRGAYGCVYAIQSPDGGVVVAAKTAAGLSDTIDPTEIESLKSIEEYYGETDFHNKDEGIHHFVFMTYHDGVRLYKTAGWEEFVSPATESWYKVVKAPGKDREKCEHFITLTIQLIASRAREYAKKGVYHKDLNFRNMLFKSDYPNNQDLAFVDWGQAWRASDPERVFREVESMFKDKFAYVCED